MNHPFGSFVGTCWRSILQSRQVKLLTDRDDCERAGPVWCWVQWGTGNKRKHGWCTCARCCIRSIPDRMILIGLRPSEERSWLVPINLDCFLDHSWSTKQHHQTSLELKFCLFMCFWNGATNLRFVGSGDVSPERTQNTGTPSVPSGSYLAYDGLWLSVFSWEYPSINNHEHPFYYVFWMCT